jgi:hypothetical protein
MENKKAFSRWTMIAFMVFILLSVVRFVSFAAVPLQSPQSPGITHGPFSICVGDTCPEGQTSLGCDFAYANPKDTDRAAARYVCEFLHNSKLGDFIRVGVENGGRCGVILISVICK